jgi:Holliday junction resolvase
MAWKNSNRKVGTSFEHDLCNTLADYGFWAHNLAQNSAGQPFDVIAARNGNSYPIDCKVCEHDVFRLVRIEENQFSAMTLWKDTGNGEGWFALRLSDGEVRMIPLSTMVDFSFTKTVLSKRDIQSCGLPLEEWAVEQ